ncbi:zinc-binding dehydrogenase [bacterium]|nr:MAG: zinc-binding dehydrogenase [bacterium]
MKAVAVFPGKREVRVIERPLPPKVTGTQVLLRILEVGICGTDREIGAFAYGTPPPGSDFLILGHEALAEVAEVGPNVTLVRKGDLVVPTVRRPCPDANCRPCRAGRQDFCVTGHFHERGIKEAHGFLQEWVVEEEEFLVPAPRRLASVAVLTEPLTVAAKGAEQAHAIQDRLPWVRPRPRALALGAGPVGLLGALSMVVNHYITAVYSLEPATSERAKIAEAFGCQYISGQDVPLHQLREKAGSFDVIYEAVGFSPVAFSALSSLGPNGVCIFTGVPALGKPREIDVDTLMRNIVLKNQVIFGTVNAAPSAYELALRELEQAMFLFPESVSALISGNHPIEEAPTLILKSGGIKQVIRLGVPSTR